MPIIAEWCGNESANPAKPSDGGGAGGGYDLGGSDRLLGPDLLEHNGPAHSAGLPG